MANKHQPGIDSYVTDMQGEIASDAGKASWTMDQWKTFYNEDEVGAADFTLTKQTLFRLYGLAKGTAVVSAIEAGYPALANQLKMSEGGINMKYASVSDFAAVVDPLVTAGTITQDDADDLQALGQTVNPRWKIRVLPEPFERYLIPATAEVQI